MKLLYGSQDFGYDTPQSDKDWLEFVYPTWKDVLANNMISKECKNEDGSLMMNGPNEMTQNYSEKSLVPLTYIKSKVGFFLLLKSYHFGDTRFSSDNSDMLVELQLKCS